MPDAAPPDTYLRVQPADNALSPGAAVRLLERCHDLAIDGPDGLRGLLFSPGPPTIECCLATRGADDGVGIYLGISHPNLDPGDDAFETLLGRFERTCRTAFPRRYDIEPVAWAPTAVLGIDGEDEEDPTTAAVDLQAKTSRPRDWQAPLTTYPELVSDEGVGETRPPLATVADALADSPVPAVYQACLRPFRTWRRDRTTRIQALEAHQDTWRDQFWNTLVGPPNLNDEAHSLPHEDQARIEGLRARDAAHSFVCSVRAVAASDGDPTISESVVREVGGAFGACGGAYHHLQPVIASGSAADHRDALQDRTVHDPAYRSLWHRVPGVTPTSRGVVADAREAPLFCLLDGARLPDAAHRGVDPTPDDRTRAPHPPTERLARYDRGMTLGRAVDGDGATTTTTVRLPPSLQALHLAWFGRTGSGKTTALLRALLDNHAATEGLDLVVAPKGDSFATDYLRAHDARFGDLEDVVYLDCSEAVPAIPFFDIRDELAAGVSRMTAVQDTVDHYLEILRSAMGAEQFDQAARSRDVIKHLVRAQFDPVNGSEAFSHRELYATMRRMADRTSPPAVSDDDLEEMLGTVTENTARTFTEIMQGVANRMETLPADSRLARIFNHVAPADATTTVTDPDSSGGGPDTAGGEATEATAPTPHFDLADLLDEDVVVVLDTGGLRSEARRVLTLVVLSNLWTALRRRKQRGAGTPRDAADPVTADGGTAATAVGDGADDADPLVNVYLEEAATIADTNLLDTLLSRGRSFDVSVTLAMQFPGQVKATAPGAYAELLNDVNTVLSGPVPVDSGLAERFATEDTPPDEAATQLRALTRGEWLTALPADFGARAPQPFVLRSAPEPAMPQGPVVRDAIAACAERSRRHAGLTLGDPSTVADAGEGDADGDDRTDTDDERPPTDSALPHTRRFPDHVEYDGETKAIRCCRCDARYDPSIDGLKRAIGCCGSMAEVDRDDIPICTLHLKLGDAEIRDSDWSVAQLLFCQAVYNAQQLRYSRLEYDLLADSMIRLREYVGIDDDAVDDLVAAGLVRDEGAHPHKLYGVTPAGRDAIGETYRSGTDYGHGQGDLDESSQHVLAVEAGRRWLEQDSVADPDSDVVEVVPYYDLDANRRLDLAGLDLAGLDVDGTVRVTLEAERINNDVATAVPADFDKMASCAPDEAVWIVLTRDAGHRVTSVLADPPDGEPRVEKTYSENSPPRKFRYDTPGLTRMVTVRYLRDSLLEDGS